MRRVLAAGDNVLVDLRVKDGEALQTKLVMVKTCEYQPATGRLRHVDLYEVSLEEAIRVDVPIVLTGQAEGVTQGGMLSQLMRTLEISCLPEQIPQQIEADCTGLKIGGTLHVRDLRLPSELHVITEPGAAVATVMEAAKEAVRGGETPEEAPAQEGEAEGGE
jgi:large subunit ribosomal protein L25